MKSQLAIAALTLAALTACGSDSQNGTETGSTALTTASTSLPPQPDAAPTTSDVASSSTASVDTTTSAPATTSTTVMRDDPSGPVVGLRLDDDAAIFGFAILQEVDVESTIDAISDALGDPTWSTQWAPMPEPLAAVGVQDYREAWWSDLRVVFERTDGVARLSSWSLGESPTGGCLPPATTEPEGESNVTTADGIGIGSGVDVVSDHYLLVNRSPVEATIVNVNPISLSFDNGEVSGVSQSRADCFADNDDM